jgi:hypothetical protein
VTNGRTVSLDGLEIRVEADGEEIGVVPWDPKPHLKYRVRITAEDGYVHELPFWQDVSLGPHERDEQDPESQRDFEGVAWVCLDKLLSAATNPRFGKSHPQHEAWISQWPSYQRESEAWVAETIAVANRLGPLLERNAAAITEGNEQVDWW